MSQFTQVKAPRAFGSMWYTWTDVDGRRKMVAHHELIDGKFVETKEYKEMRKWSEL
jgi:hypothetical protein